MIRDMATLCRGCGRALTGSYITALGYPWHEACFKCAGCGKTIAGQKFIEKGGRPYHEACYHAAFSPRCAGCGKPITDRYITALNKNWHPEHFVCAACRKPFGTANFVEKDGKAYCRRDYEELFGLRCAAGGELIGQAKYFEHEGKAYCERHYWERFGKRCVIGGEILKGQYQVNAWGDTFCEAHEAQTPKCYSCQRPICKGATGGGARYGDGRTVCNLCRKTAIDDEKAAQRVLDDVRGRLKGLGIAVPEAVIPARLADQAELLRRDSRGLGKPPSGMALQRWQMLNGQEVSREIEAVLILSGLPREHYEAVAAHELMHCYLFLNKYPKLSPRDEEGLAELSEWLWLQKKGTPFAKFLATLTETSNDPVYGAGFRAARAAMRRLGLARLLMEVKKTGRLP